MKTGTETLRDKPGLERAANGTLKPHLFVVLDCERPMSGGSRHDLASIDEVVIGRGSERSARRESVGGIRRLSIRLFDSRVSSVHARILRTPDGWEIEDGRSTNGSFIAGRPIQRAPLVDGDMIELGRTILCFRSALPCPSNSPLDLDIARNEQPGLATLVPELEAAFADLLRIAPSSSPVLIYGETGVGKDLLAAALHDRSGRSGPYIPVNCGALTENLVASQLFGHVKGAFSGADRDSPGFFRAAHKGTLFLDEIGELPLGVQPVLLRALQEGEVTAVGASRFSTVDVRVIAATHRPLREQVEDRRFRADLLARLEAFVFYVPPLRHRKEDLGLLLMSLLPKVAGARAAALKLTPAMGRELLNYDWTFNIRELQQYLTRASTLASEDLISMPVASPGGQPPRAQRSVPKKPLSAADERLRAELVTLFEQNNGNISEVARTIGKARMQVQRWTKRFGIDPERFRQSND